MNKKILVYVLTIIFVLCIFTMTAAAAGVHYYTPVDAGNFSDYSGGGGGWDSGGSSWDSGSSSWDSGSSSWDSGSSSGGGFLSGLFLGSCGGGNIIVIAVIVIVALIFFFKNRQKGGRPGGAASGPMEVADNTGVVTAAVKAVDPNFDPNDMVALAKDTYIALQEAWMARDLEKIRTLESDDLFRTHSKQIEEYKRLGRINVMERICVNEAYVHKYERDEQYEHITVYLTTRMRDYIIDEKTKQVIMGDPNRDMFGKYLLTFTRSYGTKTANATTEADTIACPHCGAPTHVTSTGKCEFCGFIIEIGTHDWVLSQMVGVKAGVHIDNSGVIIHTDKMPGGGADNGADNGSTNADGGSTPDGGGNGNAGMDNDGGTGSDNN